MEARIRSHRSVRAPPPETRANAGAAPVSGDQIEAVAQGISDALQHGTDQRSAIMAHAQAHEGAPHVAVRVGGALARQVRRER